MRDLLTGIAILLILALATAFAAPWFIDWNAWRGEAERRLGAAIGRNVRIAGDMTVKLLPQPFVTARRVSIEAAHAPASGTADLVQLELSLASLLRGELRITDGLVERPTIVWRDVPPTPGANAAPLDIPASVVIEKLSLRDAEFRRNGPGGVETMSARGDLGVEAQSLVGPWKAQGRIDFAGRRYDLRWASGVIDNDGRAALKMSLQDGGFAFVAEADGVLTIDRKGWRAPPRFEGRVTASGSMPWPFGKTDGEQPWRLAAVGGG